MNDETQLLQQAQEAAQRGDNATACELLFDVIRQNRQNETAWLWLSEVIDAPDKVHYCLKQVLKLNPDNAAARRRLSEFEGAGNGHLEKVKFDAPLVFERSTPKESLPGYMGVKVPGGYLLQIQGFEGRELLLKESGFFSGPQLLVDGEPAQRGKKRGQVVLYTNNGRDVVVELRSTNFLDPLPQVRINGQPIPVAPSLKWYHWIWVGLPVVLVFVGGALGGLCGGTAAFINGRVFRSGMNGFVKYLLTGLISVAAVFAYVVLVVIFASLIQGG